MRLQSVCADMHANKTIITRFLLESLDYSSGHVNSKAQYPLLDKNKTLY